MNAIDSTTLITSLTSMVPSSASLGRLMPTGPTGWGSKDPDPDHRMASIPNKSLDDGKPMPIWSIVMIVIVVSSLAIGLGFMIWTGRSKPCKEEARREIDLERASLEAEAKWQRSLRKAEVEEIENRQRQRQKGAEVEVKAKKSDSAESGEEEKVVVAKLAKGDDMV